MDTGAAIIVFPFNSSKPCTDLGLVTVDGSNIRSWGQRSIIVNFGQRRFVWLFRLASVDRPILGADFLAANNLMDVARRQPFAASFFSTVTRYCCRFRPYYNYSDIFKLQRIR